jgi:endonuclease/exonuclease/phosphatase family metal-dependent hydrolase
MAYKLGSFNMYKFQAYRADDNIRKELDKISNIILSEKFDILAMQEIFDKCPMDMILTRLGPNWKGAWDKPNSKSVQAAEGYAFIWNTNRIQLAESITASGKRTYSPRIYKQYRIDRKAGQQELVREPFYGRFKPKNENYEIRIINTHIMFSSSRSINEIESEEFVQKSDVEMRKNELDILIRSIYAKENSWRYGNNLPSYTVLMGDYNLNIKRVWTKWPYLEEVIEINDGKYTYKVRTVQDQLTTVKNRSRLNPDEPVRGYANNYDHFSYDEERFSDLHPKVKRIDSVRKYCDDDFEKHKKEISDHIPISLEIDLKNRMG